MRVNIPRKLRRLWWLTQLTFDGIFIFFSFLFLGAVLIAHVTPGRWSLIIWMFSGIMALSFLPSDWRKFREAKKGWHARETS